MDYRPKDIQERIAEITGESKSIQDALDQWKKERQAMLELFDENETYLTLNFRLRSAVTIAEKAISQAENDAGMFIKETTRHTIYKFRDLVKSLESTILQSQQIKERRNERKTKTN